MEQIVDLINRYKKLSILIASAIFLFIILMITATLLQTKSIKTPVTSLSPTPTLSTSSILSPTTAIIPTTPSEKFNITGTSPRNNEADVYPGEIIVSFTTDAPITMPEEFNMSIVPSLPQYWKLINNYPTNQIQAQIFGGLQTNTTYTVTVTDRNQNIVSSWSFTTANAPAESSSNLIKNEEQQTINQSYPLFNYVPYSTQDFDIDYTAKLTLIVTVKNSNLDLVKQEVQDWIRSHGVDPSTHTINYQTQ